VVLHFFFLFNRKSLLSFLINLKHPCWIKTLLLFYFFNREALKYLLGNTTLLSLWIFWWPQKYLDT